MKHKAFTLIELLVVVAIIGILASSWGAMTSVHSSHLGKKMCKGQIGIYTLSKNTNGCHREIVVQSGLENDYWTFSAKASSGVLSETICIEHY